MSATKRIAVFPEPGAIGPGMNLVGIAQGLRDLGHECSFILDPGLEGSGLRSQLKDVSSRAAEHPVVRNRADVAIGESLLEENELGDAEKIFADIVEDPMADDRTLAAAYTPYLGWLWITGDLDLGGSGMEGADSSALADPVGSMQVLLLIARAVGLALHLATVALLFLIARRLTASPGLAAVAGALFGLAPMLGFLSRTSRVDVPMCFSSS